MSFAPDEWRRVRKMTQAELGEKLGVHANTIRNWELKPSSIPIEKAVEMAAAFNVSIDDINFLP